MAFPINTQAKYWAIVAVVFLLLLWVLGDIMLPYVIGAAIAYFLDPVADRLEKLGLSRVLATIIIMLIAILIFVVAILMVVPMLIEQSISLFNTAPALATDLQEFLTKKFPSLMDSESVLRRSLVSVGESIQARGGQFLNSALASVSSLVNVALLFVIVPVVSFYLLLDWDRIVGKVDDLLPRDHAPVVRQIAFDIDRTLAGFVRGMGTVCLVLGTYYALALMLVGLQFGLVVGFIAGLITFIPYIGALIGGALAIGLGLFQFWGDWVSLGLVAGVFVIGQMIEGNILTPKLVGGSVGLHPVWLLIALSVFGSLFGFIGMLVAVPVAAVLGVVIRYVMGQYKKGRLYKGLAEQDNK
ncbi:MAG: AI-2E family transporter [Paracoccaceae bacterium]|nr:AI-2E family transporter [Paracoccaceae bacterium]MDG2256935.1 AI-2E family transporter [Paracoccaceae bacterium]